MTDIYYVNALLQSLPKNPTFGADKENVCHRLVTTRLGSKHDTTKKILSLYNCLKNNEYSALKTSLRKKAINTHC